MPRYWLTCRQNPSLNIELFADGTNEFAIGRGYENNLILTRNKLISRRHCQLFREPDKTVRIMADTDVNGVVINERLLILSGESVLLNHSDEIYIVHSRKHPEKNMSFILKIESCSDDEKSATEEGDEALSIQIPFSGGVNLASISAALAASAPESSSINDTKIPSDTIMDSEKTVSSEVKAEGSTASGLSSAQKAALKPEVQLSSSLQCSICLSILYDPVTLSPCMHNFCSGCCSGWLATNRRCPSCRHKISLISKNPSLRAILEGYVATNPEAAKSEEEKNILDAANRLHFERPFISGRSLPLNDHDTDVNGNSNPNVGNEANSDASSASGSEDGDSNSDSDFSHGNDSSSNDDSSDDDSDDNEQTNGWPVGSDTEIEESDVPERHEFEHDASSTDPVCRQCPVPEPVGGIRKKATAKSKVLSSGTANGASSSTSSSSATSLDKPSSSASEFKCRDPTQHVMCNCCESPMPDRRTDRSAPAQTCLICSLEYCNLYWSSNGGCQNGQCVPGCLKYLRDISLQSLLEDDLLTSASAESNVSLLLFGNVYETTQLRAYLVRNDISALKFRELLLDGLESGKYPTKLRTLIGQRPSRETPICSFCRVHLVQDLLFAFRMETRDPADRRPNCPHGRYCLSQAQDAAHATIVNHICDPVPPGIIIDACTYKLSTAVEASKPPQPLPNRQLINGYLDNMDLD